MLKIYVHQLTDGQTEVIEETVSPELLEIKEKDLQYQKPINLFGKAYLAEDYLIIQLKITTEATMPCLICNESVQKNLTVHSFYHTEEVANIKGHIYDYTQPMREAILLELPYGVECNGSCPKRKEIKRYLKNKGTRYPFADL